MIPSSTCSSSDLAESAPMNSMITQLGDKETEKQVIVNNYYIRDKEEGCKQVKVSEISPNNLRSYTQNKLSKISPNETTMEVTNNQISKNSEESSVHAKEDNDVRLKAELNTQVIEDQKRYYIEGPEVQNTAPPTAEHHNHPPSTRQDGSAKTTTMLDCILQLQLTLKEHVLLNSKQAEYQMSQNVD